MKWVRLNYASRIASIAGFTFLSSLLPLQIRADNFLDARLPDRTRTPGVIMTTDTTAVCRLGYAHQVRNVPYAERDRVYLAYGIPRGHRKGYVIDHLISLELGGSNSERNLWPQPRAEAKEKDRIEDELHEAVCTGRIPLREAQERIARDWRAPIPLR